MAKEKTRGATNALILLGTLFTTALSKPLITCPSGQFLQDHFSDKVCRTCGAVYKRCDVCDPTNLDKGKSFCTKCTFMYGVMGYDRERDLVVSSRAANNDIIDPDKFGWECEFELVLVLMVALSIVVVVVSSVVYYCYQRRVKLAEEIKRRREVQKKKEYDRLNAPF